MVPNTRSADIPVRPSKGRKSSRRPYDKQPWPDSLPARIKAITEILAKSPGPMTPDDIAAHFKNARRSAVQEILETLCTIGKAHQGHSEGTYLA